MARLAARLEKQFPDTNTGRSYYAISLREDLVGDVRPALLTILSAVVFVLFIACAMLPIFFSPAHRSGDARSRFGPRWVPVARALFVNSCAKDSFSRLLARLAVYFSRGGASICCDCLVRTDVPRLEGTRVNGAVIVFSLGAAVFSTFLFAMVPALQVSRPNVNESLQEGDRGAVGPESHRLRALLVIAQVALSMLLLTGAGLLIKSFGNLRSTSPGFDSSRATMIDLALPRMNYSEPS